ncbi:MAG: phosphotransferase family protein [Pseudomonadales bacterium]|nr:phosphotransferase family protein [Pseudomonadales bacterium]
MVVEHSASESASGGQDGLDKRPTPSLDDPEGVRIALSRWLSEKLGQQTIIPVLKIPEGTGMSNVTLMFDARIGKDSPTLSLVARIQPQGDKLAFPDYDLPMQCRLMQALKAIVPVPHIIGQENDGAVLGMPFYIMKKTEGLIPPDIPPYHMDGWIKQSVPETRRKIWYAGIEAMSRVHNVRLEDNPVLMEAVKQSRFPKSLNDQLAYWQNYYMWGYGDLCHESVEKALCWLQENRPEQQAMRLCWGDARMANIIVDEQSNAVAALLDWEMASLGDPLQDLAWWVYMDELFSVGLGVAPLEGFPGRQKSAQYWSELTGLGISNLGYYLVYAATRFALILGRMGLVNGNTENVGKGFEVDYLNKMLKAFAN